MNFNIRVYGLFIDKQNKILLSDEYRLNRFMTKFPGGGLQVGEGTIDCLKREFLEEMDQEIEVLEHFYTTDYFQKTIGLDPPMQLINIYYKVALKGTIKFTTHSEVMNIPKIDGAQALRWASVMAMNPEDLSFPIDRKVLYMLQQQPQSHQH